jgi:hypothetical protein
MAGRVPRPVPAPTRQLSHSDDLRRDRTVTTTAEQGEGARSVELRSSKYRENQPN